MAIKNTIPFMLSATELATYLGVSKSTAYSLLRSDNFPSLRIGKRLLVPRDKLEFWIEQQIKHIK